MSQDAKAAATPTPKEALFFMSILNSMKNKPEVDWELVAQKSGLANGKTAATRFGQIKKKWGVTGGNGDSTTTSTPKGKKTKAGSGTNTTPSKVTKKSPAPKASGKKGKAAKSEVVVKPEDDGNDGIDMQGGDEEADMHDAAAHEDDQEEVEYYDTDDQDV